MTQGNHEIIRCSLQRLGWERAVMVILEDLLNRRSQDKEPIELQIQAVLSARSFLTIPPHSCPVNGFQYHQVLEPSGILPASQRAAAAVFNEVQLSLVAEVTLTNSSLLHMYSLSGHKCYQYKCHKERFENWVNLLQRQNPPKICIFGQ